MSEAAPVSSEAADAHRTADGRFRNPWLSGRPRRFGGFLRWALLERPFQRLPSDPDPSVFPLAEPNVSYPRATRGELSVTWVGHSTTLLQLGQWNILTDPIWSERASPVAFAGPRRWVAPGLSFDDLPDIDVVLVSHNHYDHLDDRTVRDLAERSPEAAWCLPLGLEEFVRQRGVRRIHQLDWWDEVQLDGLRVACAAAQHFSGRSLRDRNATLWCGWVLSDGKYSVYYAGDTGYHPEFGRIGEAFGPFDIAILPVGAYQPQWFMSPAHLNPEEAVQAFGKVSANGRRGKCVMVPVHFGTFKLSDEPMDEPPRRTREAWLRAGLPLENLWLLAHGETRRL
ncbi:MAG: MBL fold metallo-hydrolase [Gemmatimonadota bacterium]|nr:MAG: MBL fold metallo-hydrolase [Gemmatimonadota bacterium]